MDWFEEGYLDWKYYQPCATMWELGLSDWNYLDRLDYDDYLDGYFGPSA